MNKTQTANLPAFPPQIIQDQFQRIVAPVPGQTMREAVAMAVLPAIIMTGGDMLIEDIKLAFAYADEFCAKIDRDQESPNTLQIIQ